MYLFNSELNWQLLVRKNGGTCVLTCHLRVARL